MKYSQAGNRVTAMQAFYFVSCDLRFGPLLGDEVVDRTPSLHMRF